MSCFVTRGDALRACPWLLYLAPLARSGVRRWQCVSTKARLIDISASLRRGYGAVVDVERVGNAAGAGPAREVESAALRELVDADVEIRQRRPVREHLCGTRRLQEVS